MPKARNIGHIRAFVVISTWPLHDCRRNSVDHGTQPLGPEDHVPHAVVAVHHREPARCGDPGAEPAERQLERRVRIGRDGAVDAVVTRQLRGGGRGARVRTREESTGHALRVHGVDARQRGGQLLGERRTRRGVLVVAQELPRDGLPGDEVHDEGRAESVGLPGAPGGRSRRGAAPGRGSCSTRSRCSSPRRCSRASGRRRRGRSSGRCPRHPS
jgi:hypothetical protein